MCSYHWDAGLAVTGRLRDIRQNVLQSSFRISRSRSPSCFHIFFLIALLEQAFIRNVTLIIILCINNNAIINNRDGKLQDMILTFKIPRDTRKNFFEIYRYFGRSPSKRYTSRSLEGSVSLFATAFQ
jgi:hypothetical protein